MTEQKPPRKPPMLDQERDAEASYNIHVLSFGMFKVTTYPRATSGAVRTGTYRCDVLPRWMIEAMALMDAAHPAQVHDLGVRVGENSYWIEPMEG